MSSISRKQLFLSICKLPWMHYVPIKINNIKCLSLFEEFEDELYPALIIPEADFENGGLLSNQKLIWPSENVPCLRGFCDRYMVKYGCLRTVEATMWGKRTVILTHTYIDSRGKIEMTPLFYEITSELSGLIEWDKILTT